MRRGPSAGEEGTDSWATGFVRGLAIGAMVGAAVAGTAFVRRLLREADEADPDARR